MTTYELALTVTFGICLIANLSLPHIEGMEALGAIIAGGIIFLLQLLFLEDEKPKRP